MRLEFHGRRSGSSEQLPFQRSALPPRNDCYASGKQRTIEGLLFPSRLSERRYHFNQILGRRRFLLLCY